MNLHLDIARDLPDAGGGSCCMGSAGMGPEHCTCWKTEYDKRQRPQKEGPGVLRDKMCADCAFRPDSPERRGDPQYAHNTPDELADLASETFVCHTGMRRALRLRHPAGAVVECGAGDYRPPNRSAPCKADGSPAEYCAGWWAAKLKQDRETAAWVQEHHRLAAASRAVLHNDARAARGMGLSAAEWLDSVRQDLPDAVFQIAELTSQPARDKQLESIAKVVWFNPKRRSGPR